MGRFRKLLGKVVEKASERLTDGDEPTRGRAPAPQQADLQRTQGSFEPPAGQGVKPHPLDPISSGWNQAIKQSPSADSGVDMVSVRFTNLGSDIEVPSGTTILDAALAAGVDLNHYCGGMASCGSCRVESVVGLASELDAVEKTTLDVLREGEHDRLGCQTRALGHLSLSVPNQDC